VRYYQTIPIGRPDGELRALTIVPRNNGQNRNYSSNHPEWDEEVNFIEIKFLSDI